MNYKKILLITILFLAFLLRFYKLSSNPPSLYWEEVALGYDAYSLLKTGHDHRGNSWPIVYISSYMDYKPPLYAYVTMPSIWLFGLNEFGVRFPSAFFGSLTILAVYFLSKELLSNFTSEVQDKDTSEVLGFMSALLLAISPWHLQFSRAAFEANLALFLTTVGILFFLKSFSQKIFLFFSVLFFGFSLYAYHGARVFVPLIAILLGLIYLKKLWSIKYTVMMALILGIILVVPLLQSWRAKEVQQRFQETSAFTTLEPIISSNTKINQDGGGIMARLVHHRFWEYSRIFLGNYFTYFSGTYLFLSGDGNPRHSTQEFGELYHWELITLIFGLVYLFKNYRKKSLQVLLGWLLLSPVPGAITKTNPHSLRTIFGLPAFIMISSIGLIWLIRLVKNKIFLLFAFCFLLSADFLLYLHFYYHHYPKLYSDQWQYGYRQAVEYIKENENKYDIIYLTNNYGRAYMYYLFYTHNNPCLAQQLMLPFKNSADVYFLDKVYFSESEKLNGRQLLITGPGEVGEGRVIKTINFLDGSPAFEIWEKEN